MGYRAAVAGLIWIGTALAADAAPCSITWLPGNDVFPRWGEDVLGEASILPAAPATRLPRDAKTWELVVLGETGSPLRMPLDLPGKYLEGIAYYGMPWAVDAADWARLNALGEGTFLAAIVVDGTRCSNVARVTIRFGYDPRREPVLRVTGIQSVGSPGIDILGLWVVPSESGPPMTNYAAACAVEWLVDGVVHQSRRTCLDWPHRLAAGGEGGAGVPECIRFGSPLVFNRSGDGTGAARGLDFRAGKAGGRCARYRSFRPRAFGL